jgi:hypothetical protein
MTKQEFIDSLNKEQLEYLNEYLSIIHTAMEKLREHLENIKQRELDAISY